MIRTRLSRALAAALGCILAAGTLTACGGAERGEGPIELTFWHSSSGAAADAVTKLVNEFNETHSDVHVTAFYQGNYADAITKLSTSVAVDNQPDIMQVNDANSGYMADANISVSVTDLNAAASDPFDLDEIVPAASTYYSRDGALTSMPFMVSMPSLYINPEMAKVAGLDPTKPPSSRKELTEWARAIAQATGKRGLVFHIHPWWFEEWTASAGEIYCSPENGIGDELATRFTLTSDTQVETWTDFADLYHSGVALNVGTDGSKTSVPFGNGEVGMVLASSASLKAILKDARDFEPVVAPFPIDNPQEGGVAIGGNSLWLLGDDPAGPREQAGYEFLTFMASATSQKTLFDMTGYLPSNVKAIEAATAEADAQHATALTQLLSTPANTATAGCHSGALQSERSALQPSMESFLSGGADVKSALAGVEAASEDIVSTYNHRAEDTHHVTK